MFGDEDRVKEGLDEVKGGGGWFIFTYFRNSVKTEDTLYTPSDDDDDEG